VTSEEPVHTVKEPTLLTAIVPLVILILLLFGSLLIFGLDALDGPIRVALVLSCMCAALVALRLGYRWSDVQDVGRVAMGTITSAIFILLPASALICGVIAMSIGSSRTTAGTIGVGLVGIALMLGVVSRPAITAGAVISGSPAISTSRSSCRSDRVEFAKRGWRRPISPGSLRTAARSHPRWCRGTPAGLSWVRCSGSQLCSTCRSLSSASPVPC
jgi:Na+/H+ antiporter NhaC